MRKKDGGFCCYWSSDPHITSRWSSEGPFNSPETIFSYNEKLIFGCWMKLGKISILATFPYYFTLKIMYTIEWYFICRFFFKISISIWLSNQIVQKEIKVSTWKSWSIPFLESFCNQKRYFELISYDDCKKRNLWFVLFFHTILH